ncbi:hypothetical protein [Lederbergia citri]|uniref:Uncharacterized protein n=1 Tax=Lederbergia citri TaxID=2833580 RepID=A0A942TGY3_9BACI|nr:hypothetical protein [Lederbergia citri]MBS4195952.1 hypothetical protein [Lederbergia citri]
MMYIILFASLLISSLISIWIFKITTRKWLGNLAGFSINTVIIVVAMWVSYMVDEEARIFGYSEFYLIIFYIPILSWINFFILEYIEFKLKANRQSIK